MAKPKSRKSRADAARMPAEPEPGERSGSTGRDSGSPSNNPGVDGKPGTGANSGQGNYGQSGYGQGGYRKGGDDAPAYQKDVPGRGAPRSRTSNRGSGRPESEAEDTSANTQRHPQD